MQLAGLVSAPSWAVMWDHRSFLSCSEAALGTGWAQGQLWHFVAFMEAAAASVQGSSCALGGSHPLSAAWTFPGVCQECPEPRGRGCVLTQCRAGHWEHTHHPRPPWGRGANTKHLHVPSPPCKSDIKLDPLWLQNELCHPNQRLKQSKQILCL